MEKYPEIAEELLLRNKKDQEMRACVHNGHPELWDNKIDHQNTARLKEIVEEIGWPTISKVGKEASAAAWSLAQHADHNKDLQKAWLELMKAEPINEVDQHLLAHLVDRVLVGEGKEQEFGTQFMEDSEGKMQSRPIRDPENVDERRKKVGLLEPLAEKLTRMQEKYNKKI